MAVIKDYEATAVFCRNGYMIERVSDGKAFIQYIFSSDFLYLKAVL